MSTMSTADSAADAVFEVSFDAELNLYTCSQCLTSFTDVDEHLKDHHSEAEEQQLKVETAETMHEDEIDGVAIVLDNTEGKMICEGCSKTFKSVKRFVDHLKSHGSEFQDKIDTLEERNAAIANEKERFCEQVICSNEPDKICYRCTECSTLFDTKKSIRLHYKIHQNRRARDVKSKTLQQKFPRGKLSCKVCNKSISNQKLMALHLKAHAENEIHQNRRNYEYNTDEIKNMPAEASSTVNKLACQYCHKVFKRPVEKVKHERVHTGEKPFACELCGKAFRVAYCLTLHKRSVHSDERPFVCTFEACNKRFKSQSVYNHHLATHGTEKAYSCPFCDKAFKTSVQLSGHKNTHTKPFDCSHCSRKFASLFAARTHMETHKTKILKFKCVICNAEYGRTSALNEHMRAVHPEEGFEENYEIVDQMDE